MSFSRSNKQLTTIKGKTWSRGTNSVLPFSVNVDFNLSITLFDAPAPNYYLFTSDNCDDDGDDDDDDHV